MVKFMVHGSVQGLVYGFVHGLICGFVYGLVCGTFFMVHGVHCNVLLEDGGLPCIFPSNVHLDLLSEQCTLVLPLRPFKSYRVGWLGGLRF